MSSGNSAWGVCLCECVCACMPMRVLDYCTLMLRMTSLLSSLRLPSPYEWDSPPQFPVLSTEGLEKVRCLCLHTHTRFQKDGCPRKKWEQERGWERAMFSSQWFTASWPVGSGGHPLVMRNSDVGRKSIVAPMETCPFLWAREMLETQQGSRALLTEKQKISEPSPHSAPRMLASSRDSGLKLLDASSGRMQKPVKLH